MAITTAAVHGAERMHRQHVALKHVQAHPLLAGMQVSHALRMLCVTTCVRIYAGGYDESTSNPVFDSVPLGNMMRQAGKDKVRHLSSAASASSVAVLLVRNR